MSDKLEGGVYKRHGNSVTKDDSAKTTKLKKPRGEMEHDAKQAESTAPKKSTKTNDSDDGTE